MAGGSLLACEKGTDAQGTEWRACQTVVRWIWSVTWLLELLDVSGSIGTGSSVNRSRSRTAGVTLLVEMGRIGRFRSFADLDFSLHYMTAYCQHRYPRYVVSPAKGRAQLHGRLAMDYQA